MTAKAMKSMYHFKNQIDKSIPLLWGRETRDRMLLSINTYRNFRE